MGREWYTKCGPSPRESATVRCLLVSGGARASCARVRGVVDRCQMLKVQMGINLGGCNVGVSEEFLNGTEVTA